MLANMQTRFTQIVGLLSTLAILSCADAPSHTPPTSEAVTTPNGQIWTCYEPDGGHFEYCIDDPAKLPASLSCAEGHLDPLLGYQPWLCYYACPPVAGSIDCTPGLCYCP